MKVNLTKTLGKTTRTPPEPLEIIGRKEKLKLLGVTFEQVPVNWETHIDYLLSKASSRLYVSGAPAREARQRSTMGKKIW